MGILILGQRHHWGHIIIFWWIYSCIVFIIYDCALCGTKSEHNMSSHPSQLIKTTKPWLLLHTSKEMRSSDLISICAGSTSLGWPTVTRTPPLTAPQIVNSPTLTGKKMSRGRSWSHKNNNNIMMVILIIIKIPALPGLPSHLPSPPATRWPKHILWLDLEALRGFYQGDIRVKIPWTNKVLM